MLLGTGPPCAFNTPGARRVLGPKTHKSTDFTAL